MTERLLVARTDGVVRTSAGLFRLHRGKTLAEPGHPAAVERPEAFVPMTVHLPAPDDGDRTADASSGSLSEDEIAAVEAERDHYLGQLKALARLLDDTGIVPAEQQQTEGWMLRAVAELIAKATGAAPITPPRGATKPRKAPAPRPTDG